MLQQDKIERYYQRYGRINRKEMIINYRFGNFIVKTDLLSNIMITFIYRDHFNKVNVAKIKIYNPNLLNSSWNYTYETGWLYCYDDGTKHLIKD